MYLCLGTDLDDSQQQENFVTSCFRLLITIATSDDRNIPGNITCPGAL